MPDSDHYILISADTTRVPTSRLQAVPRVEVPRRVRSVGGDDRGERPLTRELMKSVGMTKSVGVDGDPEVDGDRNWNSDRRLREQEADGWVAEVIFPNTQPPFAPAARSQLEAPPVGDDPEHRWAGLQAHNRWLADYVAIAPGARGCAQIFLGDVEGSVREIEWAAEHGLRGGIVLPGAPPGSGLPRCTRRVRADLGRVRGVRDAGEPSQRRRSPDYGMHTRPRSRCSCSRSPGGRTARSGT